MNNISNTPFEIFEQWYDEAKNCEAILDHTAFCLATANAEAFPSARILLLKGYDGKSFTFYTNYKSPKSDELLDNPKASMCFYWAEIGKQVRISGDVVIANESLSDEYFASRSREKQLSAYASRQSAPLLSPDDFEDRLEEVTKKFEGVDVPRPDFWGGWTLTPTEIEFWQTKEHRRHDRLLYSLDNKQWKKQNLNP